MKKKQLMSVVKKLAAGVLTLGMIATGIVVCPKQADAAEVKDKVIYMEYQADEIAKNYWNDEKKIAPVEEGYVFGGWFEKVDKKTDTSETYMNEGTEEYYAPLTDVSGKAFAKFVPAQVLSVKSQNGVEKESSIEEINEDTIKNIDKNNPMFTRVVTSLDSANYQKVGFEIYLANWLRVYKDGLGDSSPNKEATETTRIYKALMEDGQQKNAQTLFGGESEFLSVWELSAIDTASNATLQIYVRPYWVTTDGTKVNGLAEYVHIEDEYMGYVNVPVNLLGGERIAAGVVNVQYSGTATLHQVETGRMFENMSNNPTSGSVKMVGYTSKNVGEYQGDETLYANLRFKKLNGNVDFNITEGTFSDWNEAIVDVKKEWNTKYVQTNTTE